MGRRLSLPLRLVLPDSQPQVKIAFGPRDRLSDNKYFEFCQANHDVRIERSAQGEIIVKPRVDDATGRRSVGILRQLENWAQRDGRGKVFGPTTEFFLPNGAALSPDAAWVSNGQIARIPKEARQKFMHLTPRFVVQVMSPTDRLQLAKEKMEEWIANGVQLAWLIDADARAIYVYSRDGKVKKRTGVNRLRGEGPVAGFVLELADIWQGL